MIVLYAEKISEYEMEYYFFERKTKLVYERRIGENKDNQRGETLMLLFGGATVTLLEGILKQIPLGHYGNPYVIFFYCLLVGMVIVTVLVRVGHFKRNLAVKNGVYGRAYDADSILNLYERGRARRKIFLYAKIGFVLCSAYMLMFGRTSRTVIPFVVAYGFGLGAYTVLIWDNPITRYRTVRNIRRQLKNSVAH